MTAPCKIQENFIATEVDDEIVLIDMEGGELFSLKDSAKAIWEAIDGVNDPDDIATQMASHYEVSRIDALAGISSLLDELERANLLRK